MTLTEKLAQLGWILPPAPKPIAAYVPAVRSGNLLYISGQLPMRDGQLIARGRVPSAVSLESAQQAAAQSAVNALAILNGEIDGDIDRVARVVRIGVFVQSDNDFHDQAKIANGASELLQNVFGEIGRHARCTIGVNALPLDAAVEVECLFEFQD
ncbi:MAG: RidA family protein [Tepidisphaeraceae bacterium]|jgi:enamine deaminase RidA (YjgF/YER057c/UK114 family)